MNHIADANKMVSDTPRTNGCLTEILDADGFVDQSNCPERWVNHARELERELNAANDRIKHLRDGISKQNQTIEQACGKVLGYPWFKDDQKNFPGATEKDGVCVGEHVAETIVSELAKRHTEALARIKRLEEFIEQLTNPKFTRDDLPKEALLQRIKRLEEAGDAIKKSRSCGCQNGDSVFYCISCINAWDAWLKAKEAKP